MRHLCTSDLAKVNRGLNVAQRSNVKDPDSAVRTAMMSEYTQIVQDIERGLAEDLDTDGWEFSAHSFPAPDHAEVQGMVFTNEEFEKLQNHEPAVDIDGNTHHLEKRAIGQYNCGHIAFPFIIGVSPRAYSPERLDEIRGENEAGVEFHGKQMSLYEATQMQRQLETEMRHEREQSNLYKQVRETDPAMEREYRKSQQRLAELRDEYRELGETLRPHSIRMKMERSYVPRGSTGGLRLDSFMNTPSPPSPGAGSFNSGNIDELNKNLSSVTGVPEGSINLSSMSAELRVVYANELEKMFTHYPELRGRLTSISTYSDGTSIAKVRLGTEMGFHTDYSTIQSIETKWNKLLDINWVPKETTYKAIPIHEFGHVVNDYLSQNKYGTRGWEKRSYADRLLTSARRHFGIELSYQGEWLAKKLSRYATTGASDFLSEALAEYYNSPGRRSLSIWVAERVQRDMASVARRR